MPEAMPRRWRPRRVFSALTDGLGAAVLFVLMAMTCIDVFGREVFAAPLDGATELTQIMMGVIVFAVFPIVSLREDHITVDLLDRWFPERLARPRRVIINLIAAAVMVGVCWRVWIIGGFQSDYGDATEFLSIPLGPVSYFISVMSGVAAVVMFANAVRHLTGSGPSEAAGQSDSV